MKLLTKKIPMRMKLASLATSLVFAGLCMTVCLANPANSIGKNPPQPPATVVSNANNADLNALANPPATPSEALAADVSGYRIANGFAIYPILPGNDDAVKTLINSLAQDPDFQGIRMTLYSPTGTKPKILLSGQGDDQLRYAVQKLKTIMSHMGQPHRLVVAAYLREISISNDDAVGMSWFSSGLQGGLTSPNTTTVTTTDGVKTIDHGQYTVGLANLPVNALIGNLTKTMSKGKVIVGSEITIVNGATAEIKNDDSMPVPLTGSNNQVTFNTQTISSDVKITPTIVKFNEEKPEESIVRLDVVIQLSIPTNTVVFSSGSSALEYTTQTLTATHYVKANNEKIIGGLFASDTWTQSVSGIPVLMNIPVLKYLFSTKSRSLEHLASILTIAVRILPVDKETGYDY